MKFALAVVALLACGRDRGADPPLFEPQVVMFSPPGMSDLTLDDRGVMWAIAERGHVVVELELGKLGINHPLEGVPGDHDTEALAWLGNGRFAIGLEGAHAATAGIAFAELRGHKLVVTRTRMLDNAELGIELTGNHGIEAVCGNADELLAACETVGKLPDGTRWAPLVRLRGDAITVTKLRLTTDRGKISALHCVVGADGTAEVIAIERHFGVARFLRFTAKRDDVEITPIVDLDLHPVLRDSRNLEGIVRLRDGRLVVINDNQSATVKGPTELLVFPPR